MGREALARGQVGRVEILSKQFAPRLVLSVKTQLCEQYILSSHLRPMREEVEAFGPAVRP